ncbi:hypothetical protein FGIG_12078 [Fasciola gigantica]|uniref:Uncharacterized protein n=1 Tax=Fasciola gigantica TaxID=46835 RepID=A0A504YWS7_FASGI|nr:hypothetical protein FGIG_12078 [Fasciola gigantica]
MPEATAAESEGRLGYDLSLRRFHLQRISTSQEEPMINSFEVAVEFRFGRRQTPDGQPRTPKVALSAFGAAGAVLYRAHKLKGESVTILRDLSPEQLQRRKLAITGLHGRRSRVKPIVIRDFPVRKLRSCQR